jgi:23S rRNA (cytosine1962-C5)-methyltransferase
VIDLYETTAVVEVNTRGMELLLPYLECALGRLGLSDSTIASGSVSARLEGVTVERCSNQPLLWAKENGFAIPVPLQSGQKTGWFCDQRDNRKHMGEWIRRLQVESVLNLFSYTGGFALYALAAGARHVVNVDRDANALSLGEEMVARNGFDANAVRSCRANVWEYLASSDETFDCVIVDPPAFVKEQSKKAQALEGYRKLLRASLRRVKEGGVLSLFSCSHFVTLEDLAWIVRQVSAESGHSLQTIARFGHSCDHSIPVWFMEAEYLKGLLLRKIGS